MTSHASETERTALFPQIPVASWFANPMLNACTHAGTAWSEAYVACQNELMQFSLARFRSDSELGRKLIGCRDWAETAKLQQEWAAATVQEYMNEADRIRQLTSHLGANLIAFNGVNPASAKKREQHRAE